jgi:hypothetical protein
MKITFNEESHEVSLTAETADEVKGLYKQHLKVDIDDPESLNAYAEAIAAKSLTVTLKNAKRPWHRVEASIDRCFLVPYVQQLEKITGFNVDRCPDVVISKNEHNQYRVTEVFEVSDDQFHFIAYEDAEPWNGMTSQQYATKKLRDHFAESVSYRPPVPEYLENGNGSYKRNPDYATGFRNPLAPSVKHAGLWLLLWEWWSANHATPGQRDVIQRITEGFPKLKSYDRHPWELGYHGTEYRLYVPDENGECNYDGKGRMMRVINWKQFAALK